MKICDTSIRKYKFSILLAAYNRFISEIYEVHLKGAKQPPTTVLS